MNKILKIILITLIALTGVSLPAVAAYIPFNTNVNMNIGIGTSTPQGAFVVTNGNVGVGTWSPIVPLQIVGIGTQAPYGGGVIINNGNVGIGTTVPGSALYVSNGVITSYSTLASNGEGIVTYAGNGKAINMQAGTANANILYDNTGGFSFQSVGRGQVLAGISSSTSITMNIDTNGNVGIGTVSAILGGLVVQNGNVGFGTFFPQTGLAVMNGNVGIGTWTAKGGNLIVNGGGNVGIGSAWPGTLLDVQGTVRALNFIGNGSGLTNLSSSNYWLNDLTGNVGISTTYAVGIGTSFVGGPGEAAFSVMNGNVGIGTWIPSASLDVETAGNTYFGSNVGIGSSAPGEALDIQGVLRTTNFNLSTNPTIGYVLTTDNFGNGTWQSVAITSGWTISGNNVYETSGGNVGIGTTFVSAGAALSVMNGNVGIGTWAPVNTLAVAGNETIGSAAGYLSPVNAAPFNGLMVQGNVGIGTFYTGSNNLTIGTYGSTVPGGTVGIGTSSTANSVLVNTNRYSLEIDGQYGLMGVFSNSTGRAGIIEFGAGAGNSVFGYTGYNGSNMAVMSELFGRDLLLGTNSTEIMRLTYGGNVGIGTITPVAELGIVGNVGIGTGMNSPYVTTTPPSGGMIVQGNVGIGSLHPGTVLDVNGTARMGGFNLTGNGAASSNVLVSNGVGVGTWMPASTLITGGGTNYWLNTAGVGNVGISTSNTVGIGTSSGVGAGLVVMNGNVGIGTWKPASLLDIGNATVGDVQIDSVGDIAAAQNINAGGYLTSGFDVIVGSQDNAGGVWFGASQSGVGMDGSDISNILAIETSNNVRINIDASGNVGIGTVSGISKLNVNGGVGIGTSLTNGAYLNFNAAPSGGLIVQNNVGIGTFNPFGGKLIVTGGNVGIGSLSPGQALDVNGTARVGGFTLTGNGAASGNVLVGNGVGVGTWMPASSLAAGSNYWLLNGGAGNVGINTSYAVGIGTSFVGGTGEGALSVMNGNVGIGTWAPTARLSVIGGAPGTAFGLSVNDLIPIVLSSSPPGAGTNTLVLNNTVGAGNKSNQITFDSNGTATWTISNDINSNGSDNFAILDAAFIRLYIDSSGNVGLGTVNPQGGLIVMNGNVGMGTWVPGAELAVNGSSILGVPASSSSSMISNGTGSLAVGYANGGTLEATGPGSVAMGEESFGTLQAGGASGGSIAMGYVLNGSLQSIGAGSIAMGYVNGGTGSITSSGQGSIAMGYANALPLSATGTADVAIGDDVQATGTNNSFALGFNVINPMSSSFMVGFNTLPTLTVTGTGVGIGTLNPFGGSLIVIGGNVGIGSLAPGQVLDVNGTARMGGFTLTGNGAASGNVLVGNGVGVGTWMPASTLATSGGSNYWLLNGGAGNVGINTSYAVGIGTSFVGGTGEAALSVMNGNVGIGTWLPSASLEIRSGNLSLLNASNIVLQVGDIVEWGNPAVSIQANTVPNGIRFNTYSAAIPSMFIDLNGNVGIGTILPASKLSVNGGVGIGTSLINGAYIINSPAPSGGLIVQGNVGIGTFNPFGGQLIVPTTNGNVGIGSLAPGQALDVTGTVRAIGLTMSGQTPISGYVLTASDGNGDATWSPSSSVGTNYWLNDLTGNVGISTAYAVGIGTSFVGGTGEAALSILNGNVGIGTWVPNANLQVAGGTLNLGSDGGPVSDLNIYSPTVGAYFNIDNHGNFGGINSYGIINMLFSNYLNNSGQISFNTTVGGTAYTRLFIDNAGDVGLGGNMFNGGFSLSTLATMVALANGNVGIGTFNPISTLGVVGNIGIGTGINSPYVNTSPPSGGMIVQGNVGIGSLAPGQKLDVQGTVRMTGFTLTGNGAGAGNVMVSNTIGVGTWMPTTTLPVGTLIAGTPNQVAYYSAATTIASNSAMVFNAPNVGLGTVTPLATLQVIGNIGIGTVANGDKFITTSPPNGGMIVEGNVGIGTWLPTNLVQINGPMPNATTNLFSVTDSLAPGGFLAIGNSTNGLNEYQPQITGVSAGYPGNALIFLGEIPAAQDVVNANDGVIDFQSIRTGGSAVQNSPLFAFLNSTGSVMLIDKNGNVGIGTNNPFGGGLIVTNGNVGIGTLAPGQLLDVKGTIRDLGELVNGNIGIGTSTPQTSLVSMGNVGIGTWSAGGGNLIVNGGSNVGIGTAWPGQMLDIQGTVRDLGELVNGNIGVGTSFVNGTGEGAISVMNGNVGIGTWTPAGQLDVEGTLSVIYLKGNVGIGTSTVPAYNLDLVNGTSRSRPVRRIVSFPETVSVTVTINSNTTDVAEISGFNNAAGITLTLANPSPSTPNDGDFLEIRVKDGGTAITIAYGANFTSTTTTMPLTTVISTWLRILFEYNSTTAKWECVAST